MLYAIQAQVQSTVTDKSGTWHGSRQVPTFYVDAAGRGEANIKAREIVNPVGDANAVHLVIAPVTAAVMAAIAA